MFVTTTGDEPAGLGSCRSRTKILWGTMMMMPHVWRLRRRRPTTAAVHAWRAWRQQLSSSTAVVVTSWGRPPPAAIDDDADEQQPAEQHNSTSTLLRGIAAARPRLQALRQRLQHDEKDVIRQFSGGGRNKLATPLPKSAPTTSTTATPSPSAASRSPNNTTASKMTATDIHALVQSLPDVPSAQVLTDTFQRHHSYLRISVTERCNLRCTYCMPADGVPLQPPSHLLTTPEILQLTQLFVAHGVHKVRLTGGEPTLRRDLVDIVAGVHDILQAAAAAASSSGAVDDPASLSSPPPPPHIGMTTNGVTLAKQLPALVRAGLSHVNVSLDTLRPDRVERLTRRPGAPTLQRVHEALHACGALLPPGCTKLNCVVMRDTNMDELSDFVQLAATTYPGLIIRFIEYMPFDANGWHDTQLVSYQEMLQHYLPATLQPEPDVRDRHDTTKWYLCDDTNVRVGFITSMTSHFCASCNRLRLTADGQLKVCLFDHTEVSLRDAVRSGLSSADVAKLIQYAVHGKKASLGGHGNGTDIAQSPNRPMTLIGG